MKYSYIMKPRSYSPSSATSYSSSCSGRTVYKRNYEASQIRAGLKKSVPAAIVIWAFHKLPATNGLTSRRVIRFLKKHYKVANDPRRTGRAFGKMLRFAMEFGVLRKRGDKYFLAEDY